MANLLRTEYGEMRCPLYWAKISDHVIGSHACRKQRCILRIAYQVRSISEVLSHLVPASSCSNREGYGARESIEEGPRQAFALQLGVIFDITGPATMFAAEHFVLCCKRYSAPKFNASCGVASLFGCYFDFSCIIMDSARVNP
ncbi:hypothetical protein MGYG_04237 [Nannizzia gypsea CBS 118893]|uniref:Uncharacterized protein n=1 Tax=Arthroderma gypseum (strain ATCC MYA-4604 / CBS 118893) TaxID=535722 RepID=E4URX6_ARTGP|nr:hypothetical protein MGYG_04237 [Nannizzia gypsea CBS 118893]EFR01233.1 hypothetical protein MGYG_04237 [Nannizzia gypsea CBS 118893]